jgi:hypothetical protein
MRRTSSWHAYLVGIAILVLPGCQRLHYQTNFKLNKGDFETCSVLPPRTAQEVTVTITSPGSPVEAYVVLEKDREAAQKAVHNDLEPANALAKGRGEELTLSVSIPAKSGFSILVGGASKPCKGQIKATGN